MGQNEESDETIEPLPPSTLDQGQGVSETAAASRGNLARQLMGAGRGWLKPEADPIGDLIREREQDDKLDQADERRDPSSPHDDPNKSLDGIYTELGERYQSGEHDVAARHDEHQP